MSATDFVGKKGPRTLFKITNATGYPIPNYSAVPAEEEVILLPASTFLVRSIEDLGNGQTQITLEYKGVSHLFPIEKIKPAIEGVSPSKIGFQNEKVEGEEKRKVESKSPSSDLKKHKTLTVRSSSNVPPTLTDQLNPLSQQGLQISSIYRALASPSSLVIILFVWSVWRSRTQRWSPFLALFWRAIAAKSLFPLENISNPDL